MHSFGLFMSRNITLPKVHPFFNPLSNKAKLQEGGEKTFLEHLYAIALAFLMR